MQYRRYHHVKISDLCSDFKNAPSVKSANCVVDLYELNECDLGDVLDRYALFVSWLTKKDSTDLLSDSYQCAKSLRCQFERT